ncbi:MAG: hypothetical protein GYA57_02965 [Myxococcales bacterium]|nr:hypothetical protein [Myxococcales bacterium]
MVTLNAAAAARLRAELDHDLTQLARVRDQIAVRASATDETTTYALALLLMNYYTGVEKLLRRVALNFGGLPPAGERWHAGLLEGLTIDLPGLRPRCCVPRPPNGWQTCFGSGTPCATSMPGPSGAPTSTGS